MEGEIAVGIVQIASCADKTKNLAKAQRMLVEAADNGAELVLLPELFNYLPPRIDKEAYAEQAEGIDGKTLSMVADVANEKGIAIIAGSMIEREGAELYNTCYAVSPKGIVAKYRKTHLFTYGKINEGQVFKPGVASEVAEIAGFRVGLTICFDLRFPELYRKEAIDGAELISNVAAFLLETGKAHWMTLLRARAIENQIYIVAANQALGGSGGPEYFGHSCIVDPWGKVIALAGVEECIISGVVKRSRVSQVREKLHCIEAARGAKF